jgi:pimeloyl-ACP methyl ester carboxylesterase
MHAEAIRPPSALLLLAEGRALFEIGALAFAGPLLSTAPKGDGHPVLVLPGLAASDGSTVALRRYLEGRGYDVHAWELGRNLGLRGGTLEKLIARLDSIHAASGRKVSLVGWSLGGVFARELAKLRPEIVRQVISLGSPFAGDPRANNAWRVYEFFNDHPVDQPPIQTTLAEPPPVPTTSIYSRTDGIVSWRSCQNEPGDRIENIEVESSHVGMGFNAAVLYAVADRLAQAEGEWAPFDRSGARGCVYKDPARTH